MKKYRLAVLNTHPIQYFAPLYRRLSREEDVDVTVYYCSRQGSKEGFLDKEFAQTVVWDIPLLEGYRYVFLNNLWGDKGVGGFFSLINPAIILELFKQRYDAVLIHGHNSFTHILALLAAKCSHTAVLMRSESHLLLKRTALKKFLRKLLLPALYSLCDGFLFIGTRNREFYEHFGVAKNKLFDTPYAVDNEFFMKLADDSKSEGQGIRDWRSSSQNAPLVLFASKLMPRKRALDLIKAYCEIRKKGRRAALALVGDGPERTRLEAYVQEEMIPDVFFAGFQNQSQLPQWYRSATVFVLPSDDEPWGLVINEVMCAGLPVITTAEVGASPDLIKPGQTGFLYPAGDIQALETCLEKVLFDTKLQKELSVNCRDRIARWSHDQCVGGIRAALEYTRNKCWPE